MWSVCRRVNNHVHLWKVNTVSHTPGPWHNDCFLVTATQGRREICHTGEGRGTSEECEANARLIAAAPDLLAALVGVVRVADRATVEFDAARAAIAKATAQ